MPSAFSDLNVGVGTVGEKEEDQLTDFLANILSCSGSPCDFADGPLNGRLFHGRDFESETEAGFLKSLYLRPPERAPLSWARF